MRYDVDLVSKKEQVVVKDDVKIVDRINDPYLVNRLGSYKNTPYETLIQNLYKNPFLYNEKLNGLKIDDKAHEVSVDDEVIYLTPKEYDLLKYLVANKNIALSREQLLTNVWGYDFYGDDRTIDTHVKTLRKNLGSYGDNIKTIRGVGYKFEWNEK